MTEQVLCLAKRCAEEDPRAALWVDVLRREGPKVWFRVPSLRDVPREGIDRSARPLGWHLKLLPHVRRFVG